MPKTIARIACALAFVVGCAEAPPPPAAAPPPPPPVQVAPPPAPPPPPPVVAVEAPPPPPAPPVKHKRKHEKRRATFDLTGHVLRLPGPVVFETGSDRLSPVSDEVLEVVEDYLVAKPDITLLRIEGHTDSDGSPPANQALSEKRAMAVARWLVAQGVACSRVLPVGFGDTKPLVPNNSADNKAQNRRVAFINAALKGKVLGGTNPEAGGHVAGDPCH